MPNAYIIHSPETKSPTEYPTKKQKKHSTTMDPNKIHVSHLESLPQDLLGEIVSRIGFTSPQNYHNCILSCKELCVSSDDKRLCKKPSLAPLVSRPLAANNYKKLMDKWLTNNNPDAHYIKGILEYFLHSDKVTGLYHFSMAADAGHK